MKRMIRYGMKPVRYRIVVINVLLALALTLTRVLTSLLFGVTATDALTLGAVTVTLAAVALVACWLPARRSLKLRTDRS